MDFDSDVDAFIRFSVDIRPTKHFVVWLREWSVHRQNMVIQWAEEGIGLRGTFLFGTLSGLELYLLRLK